MTLPECMYHATRNPIEQDTSHNAEEYKVTSKQTAAAAAGTTSSTKNKLFLSYV